MEASSGQGQHGGQLSTTQEELGRISFSSFNGAMTDANANAGPGADKGIDKGQQIEPQIADVDALAFGDREAQVLHIEDADGKTRTYKSHASSPDRRSRSSVTGSRSIEIFFGTLKTFDAVYGMLCSDVGLCASKSDGRIPPSSVKKLVFVGHPIQSFAGINAFSKLVEAWVTNCTVQEMKWDELSGLKYLHKLYVYNCKLRKMETVYFENLKVLWLARNHLQSLSFLGQGLVCLQELNVAQNEIIHVSEEHLFKCVNLVSLNLSGNPICVIQDLKAIRVLSTLKSLFLCDPLYGKCPVATLCDSRVMLLHVFNGLSYLDGKRVSSTEMHLIREHINSRCLFYYSELSQCSAQYVIKRKGSIAAASKNFESIGSRLKKLVRLAARYRRTLRNVEVVPIFTTAKNLMKDQLLKIETRINKLREWKDVSLKRLEVIMQISRWEQEVEKWLRILEFQTYGNLQFRIAHSVHGSNICDGGTLFASIHELLSALACPGLWPQNTLLKVDTIISVRDKGLEAGMEKVFFDEFAWKDEPKYVPPEPDEPCPISSQHMTMNPLNPYCPPATTQKPVISYMPADYQPPMPAFSFPDSVPGLPERSQPLFMWLVMPSSWVSNPLGYLDKIIREKRQAYKEIRLTNCLWMACHYKATESVFCIAVILKVLEECLQPVPIDKKTSSSIMRHSLDCGIFSLKKPLCYAPAYVVAISFSQESKNNLWSRNMDNDDDITIPGETAIASLLDKIKSHGSASAKQGKASTKSNFYLKRVGDGFHADMAAVQIYTTTDGKLDVCSMLFEEKHDGCAMKVTDAAVLERLLPKDTALIITSLDLAGNNLGIVTALNLPALRKLNLSHNDLTTLTGLPKLPNLIELKAGWNSLRFLQSNIGTLARSAPKLLTLEILPNPFQDIRDIAHVPTLLQRNLPLLHKVDMWHLPFTVTNNAVPTPPKVYFVKGKHSKDPEQLIYGSDQTYNLSNQALTQLPHFPVSFFNSLASDSQPCVDMNFSNNYLTSCSLFDAFAAMTSDWYTSVTRIQLQENSITSLEWMAGSIFPNCYALDLSMNGIDSVVGISDAFPRLKHLHLSHNPIPCAVNVLSTLPNLIDLLTLDLTACPVAKHPEYGSFVLKRMPSVKILDGSPINQWQLMESTEKLGGVLTSEWLEEKLGQRDWGSITQLSLGSSGLQKISLPSQSMSKLLSLDLQDNNLDSFGNLSSLLSLKVLCVSHNNITSLGGSPCPVCYCKTVESQVAHTLKARGSVSASNATASPSFYEWNGKSTVGVPPTQPVNKGTGFDSFGLPLAHQGTKCLPCHVKNDARNTGATAWGFSLSDTPRGVDSSPPDSATPVPKRVLSRPLFPKLEVLIMSHNGLNTTTDLHLHSMQNLQTIILNCNNLTSFQGLENIPTVRALVLDHNKIKDVPFNSLSGCKSLKYLHLEHNRITSLPRLPHLTNLTNLYLAHNKIQSLTDVPTFVVPSVNEVSLYGNPITTRNEYRMDIAARFTQLQILDGKDLVLERLRLRENSKWNHHSMNDFYSHPQSGDNSEAPSTSREPKTGKREFLLRARLSNNPVASARYNQTGSSGKPI